MRWRPGSGGVAAESPKQAPELEEGDAAIELLPQSIHADDGLLEGLVLLLQLIHGALQAINLLPVHHHLRRELVVAVFQ